MREFKLVEANVVKDKEVIVHEGKTYPKFNTCDHLLLDMSDMKTEEDNWMNTISIKLPNNMDLTLCVMQPSVAQSCVDVKFHGDNKDNTATLGIKNGSSDVMRNMDMYTIMADVKRCIPQ